MVIMEMMVTHFVLLGMESLMALPLQQEMSLAVVSISSTTLVFTQKMESTSVIYITASNYSLYQILTLIAL